MPASVTSTTRAPVGQVAEQLGGAGRLVALEVGHDPGARHHLQPVQQPPQSAGVLRGDHVGTGQLGPQPWGGVGRVADRRRGQHHHTGGRLVGHAASLADRAARATQPTYYGSVTRPVLEVDPGFAEEDRPPSPAGPPGSASVADHDRALPGGHAGRPDHRMGRHAGDHRDRLRHPGGQPGLTEQAGVRRDLLRQGRVLAAEVRLRAQLARRRQPQGDRGHARRDAGHRRVRRASRSSASG